MMNHLKPFPAGLLGLPIEQLIHRPEQSEEERMGEVTGHTSPGCTLSPHSRSLRQRQIQGTISLVWAGILHQACKPGFCTYHANGALANSPQSSGATIEQP